MINKNMRFFNGMCLRGHGLTIQSFCYINPPEIYRRFLWNILNVFKQFLDALKRLGIAHDIKWKPSRVKWQAVILQQGFNITALSCTVVTVGETDFLFANGCAVCFGPDQEYGPTGLFLFSRNRRTNVLQQRVSLGPSGERGDATGIAAIVKAYPHEMFASQ